MSLKPFNFFPTRKFEKAWSTGGVLYSESRWLIGGCRLIDTYRLSVGWGEVLYIYFKISVWGLSN